MELLVHLLSLDDYNLSYFAEENRATVEEILNSKIIEDDVQIINKVPEQNFKQEFTIIGHETLLSFPVKKLLEDLINDNSSVNRFFGLTSVKEKANFFLEMWTKCMEIVLGKFRMKVKVMGTEDSYIVYYGNMLVDEIGVLGHEFRSTPTFRIELPKEVVKKYYPNPENYIPELEGKDYQQFFDFEQMDPDDLKEYVLPYYYVDLGESRRARVRDDVQMQQVLTDLCIESFFGELA